MSYTAVLRQPASVPTSTSSANVTVSSGSKILATVCDSLPTLAPADYLVSLDKIRGSLIYKSLFKNQCGKVCVFIKAKPTFWKVLSEGGITVQDNFIIIRRYVQAGTKVVLSNVVPTSQRRHHPDITIICDTRPSDSPSSDRYTTSRARAYSFLTKQDTVLTSRPISYDNTNYTVYLSFVII